MRIISSVSEMQSYADSLRKEGMTIGFVPTMGALHEGHLSLIRKSIDSSDKTILSIFVNPTQFSPLEDFGKYPRDFEQDEKFAEELGVDIIFYPAKEDIYPNDYSTYTIVEGLSDRLEGKSRPSHFKGVTTVVNKLFNIVKPHIAFFGQKDAQQALIIKRMITDLNMDIDIVICPTIREDDGLALSSRNSFLSPEARKEAAFIHQALKEAESLHLNGDQNSKILIQKITDTLNSAPIARIDYVAIVDSETLLPVESTEQGALVAVAVFFDTTRLIDNILLTAAK